MWLFNWTLTLTHYFVVIVIIFLQIIQNTVVIICFLAFIAVITVSVSVNVLQFMLVFLQSIYQTFNVREIIICKEECTKIVQVPTNTHITVYSQVCFVGKALTHWVPSTHVE